MKKIEKEVKKTIVQYESIDGKIFANEKDCEEWEKTYQCTVMASVDKIKHLSVCGVDLGIPWATEDSIVWLVRPKDLNEIVLLNMYIKFKTNGGDYTVLTNDDIGKNILLDFGYGYDYCSVYNLEGLISNIQNAANLVIAEYEKEN